METEFTPDQKQRLEQYKEDVGSCIRAGNPCPNADILFQLYWEQLEQDFEKWTEEIFERAPNKEIPQERKKKVYRLAWERAADKLEEFTEASSLDFHADLRTALGYKVISGKIARHIEFWNNALKLEERILEKNEPKSGNTDVETTVTTVSTPDKIKWMGTVGQLGALADGLYLLGFIGEDRFSQIARAFVLKSGEMVDGGRIRSDYTKIGKKAEKEIDRVLGDLHKNSSD